MESKPIALVASEVEARKRGSSYPAPFAARVEGREKRVLGDLFGLTNFGVNLTKLAPHTQSSLRHTHSRQDEFIYVVRGHPTLITNEGATRLAPGMCAGFKAGNGNAHHLVNATSEDVVYIEIGDRSTGDSVDYPDDDMMATVGPDGKLRATHKEDGSPY